jgi:hypothetical protein
MFQVKQIVELQTDTVSRWHQEPIDNGYDGLLSIVCRQHAFNYQLWHQEDIARSPDVGDRRIAEVKRKIDQLNQSRNDWIEKIDDWITSHLLQLDIQPAPQARLNTETCGSAIDRLSIMALRIYHLSEQLDRDDVDNHHRTSVEQKIQRCLLQQSDLSQSLAELAEDILDGRKRHCTYRQFKMYNDPSLNPYLYQAREVA